MNEIIFLPRLTRDKVDLVTALIELRLNSLAFRIILVHNLSINIKGAVYVLFVAKMFGEFNYWWDQVRARVAGVRRSKATTTGLLSINLARMLSTGLTRQLFWKKPRNHLSKMLRSVSTLTRCLVSKTPNRRYSASFKSTVNPHKAEYRCCIVGSGPAALYTAEEIKKKISHDAIIDFYERLPTPFGLIRYGVAPGK